MLNLELEAETNRLRALAPEWRPEYADHASDSMESRSGQVKTDTEYSELLTVPIVPILSKALEINKQRDKVFVEKNPYAGLSANHPVRAFSALRMAAKQQDFPEWAWGTFLSLDARQGDKPRFVAFIAEQLVRYPNEAVVLLMWPVSCWLLGVGKILASQYPKSFDRVLDKLIQALAMKPGNSFSGIMPDNNEPDWATDAINASTENVAKSLFNDSRLAELKSVKGFPPDWLKRVNALFALSGEPHRHALVIFASRLNWFYDIDSGWSENNLLCVLDSDDTADKSAFWGGFLGCAVPEYKLFMRLKPYLLKLAKNYDGVVRQAHLGVLAGIILAGWSCTIEGTSEQWISDNELRDVLVHTDDALRSIMLFEVNRCPSETNVRDENKQPSLLPELLKKVWPRQKTANSPKISACLCNLVFSNEKMFPELVKIVLPLLIKIKTDDYLSFPNLWRSKESIVAQYPRQTLAILHAILPDNASSWPYEVGDTLIKISEANNELNNDERLLELRRKWNAR